MIRLFGPVLLAMHAAWSAPNAGTGQPSPGESESRAAPGAGSRTWAVLPVGVVNPENGIGAGLKFIDRAFLAGGGRPGDELELLGYVTSKGQAEAEVEHRRLHWAGTSWRTGLQVEGFYYPETWFGGGNHPRESDRHVYTPLGWSGVADLGHPLGAGLLLKGFLETRFVEMTALEATGGGPPDPDVLPPELAGYRGGWDGLFGLALEFDTRDDESLPSRGWHAGQRAGVSPPGLDYGYAALETWTAAYAAPHPRWETAVKVQQATILGRAPFYAYPYLGDKRLLRGISEKRLRDRSAQAAQAEVRWGFRLALPLVARYFGEDWQVAAFGGAGRVGEDFRSAFGETLHWAGGVGGRLIIGRRLGALRGDLGFSRSGYGLYVDFNQAF